MHADVHPAEIVDEDENHIEARTPPASAGSQREQRHGAQEANEFQRGGVPHFCAEGG